MNYCVESHLCFDFYFFLGIMLINIQGEDFRKILKIYIKPYLHYKFLTQKIRIKQIMII